MSAPGFNPDKSFEYFSLGDWEKTVQEAYQFGRTGSVWQRFKEQVSLIVRKRFNLPSTIYEVAVGSFISRELEIFLKKTESAQFAINTNGGIYIMSEKIGESLDKEEIMKKLKEKVASFDSSLENFKAEIDAPIATEEKLKPFLKLAGELAQKTNLIFHYKNYEWRLSGARLATWLSVNDKNSIQIDTVKLQSFLAKTVATVINDPPENSRFEMQNGELKEITAGKAGNVVDIVKTAEKVEKIIPEIEESFALTGNLASAIAAVSPEVNFNAKTGIIYVPIEVVQEEPRVTKETITQYGITELVGSSKTSFKGSSADRKNNITIGASKLNGLLIAPGEEFSAVNSIGYVTEEAGYAKEFVIKDNKSVKELGGGLCQIGTTLFRMALNAGLPVTERQEHRYVVSYYGPGLDATIYGPHPDLKFINDTGHYLLLQGRVDGTDLILELYGQKDGRQVIISDPILTDKIPAPPTKYIPTTDLAPGIEKCSETPRAGVTANVLYKVALRNGEIREQNFKSIYQPWQKVCLIGSKR
jgi:vancomycin resistance protein YoaR